MQMGHKKSRIDAKNVEWRFSDQKELCSETKIILALKNRQPLEIQDICTSTKINKSTFYRHYRVLEHNDLIKRINGKFALWNYNEPQKTWERVQKRMLEAGGLLIDLEVEKLELGDRDPITGLFKKIFDKKVSVQGVLITKAAKELSEAAKVTIPDEYNAVLITTGSVDLGDRFKWQEFICTVWNADRIFEGNTLSYKILYLKNALNS